MKPNNILFLVLISGFLFSCSKDNSSVPLVGNWVKTGLFDGPSRSDAVTIVIEDTAYVIGGYNSDGRLKDVWKFNPAVNGWRRKDELPDSCAARTGAVGFAIGNKGYFGTGYDGKDSLKDFWEFEPSKPVGQQWTRLNDFGGTSRFGAVAFVINGKGYVATGYDGQETRDLWEYAPESDIWVQKMSMLGDKRYNAVVFVINNKAYVCSGYGNGVFSNNLEMYDPVTNIWARKRKITNYTDESFDDSYNILRQEAVAFVIDGKGYITGGQQDSIMDDTWEYDPLTDLWTQKSNFEGAARTNASTFTINNRGFVLLGRSNYTYLGDVWEFKPNETSSSKD
jgi:N-acetylneuraminic acid mutarotase